MRVRVRRASRTERRLARSSGLSSARAARRSARPWSAMWRGLRGVVVEDEVVEADVEGLGEAGDGFQRWGDAPVFRSG